MTPVTAVQGTWGRRQRWWRPDSSLWAFLTVQGLRPAKVEGRVFEWETGLGSALLFWRRWFGQGVEAWAYAGRACFYFLSHFPVSERNVVAHSFGGYVVLHAAALGLRINRLVTVATPIREDQRAIIDAALPNIAEWFQVYDRDRDRTATLGRIGDAVFGGGRYFRYPDVQNVGIPGIGHAGLLRDQDTFHYWQETGLIACLRGDDDGRAADID